MVILPNATSQPYRYEDDSFENRDEKLLFSLSPFEGDRISLEISTAFAIYEALSSSLFILIFKQLSKVDG